MKIYWLEYLQNTADVAAYAEKMDVSSLLPLMAEEQFAFYRLHILGTVCIVACPITEINSLEMLGKLHESYGQRLGVPMVFLFRNLSSIRRKRLLALRIPFLVENGQMYLPFLALHLKPVANMDRERPVRFNGIAQLLFLYYLYHPKDGCTVMELGKWMQASDMSASRGLSELHELGLLSYGIVGETKKAKRYVRISTAGFLEQGRSLLINPVMKTYWIRKEELNQYQLDLPYAGLDCLARKSDIVPPRIPVRAIWHNTAKVLKPHLLTDTEEAVGEALVELQLWKYDPRPLATDGCVDSISLALSLQDIREDRVLAALASLLLPYPDFSL